MKNRLPLAISVTALLVAVLGWTPLADSLFTHDAAKVNGIGASRTPKAGKLLALNGNGKLPASVLPSRRPTGASGHAISSPGLVNVIATSQADSTPEKTIQVSCPAGKLALGGGAAVYGVTTNVGIITSAPTRQVTFTGDVVPPTGWRARAIELNSTSTNWKLAVYAICFSPSNPAARHATAPSGPNGLQVVEDSSGSNASDADKDADVSCPTGKVAVGGGADVIRPFYQATHVGIVASTPKLSPSGSPIGWRARAVEIDSESHDWGLAVAAICVVPSSPPARPGVVAPTPGFSAVEWVRQVGPYDAKSDQSLDVSCPPGKLALGGGAEASIDFHSTTGVAIAAMTPGPNVYPAIGWQARAVEIHLTSGTWALDAHVICATVTR